MGHLETMLELTNQFKISSWMVTTFALGGAEVSPVSGRRAGTKAPECLDSDRRTGRSLSATTVNYGSLLATEY